MVRDLIELDHTVSGNFIINPRLSIAPTQFLGVLPCADFEKIGDYDGCYILAPAELVEAMSQQLHLPSNPIPKPTQPFPDFSQFLEGVGFTWQDTSSQGTGSNSSSGGGTSTNAGQWLPSACTGCSRLGGRND